MRELHASTNYVAQEPGRIAHFGVGRATVVDQVWAEWVTGDATVLTGVSVDQQLSVPSPRATVSSRTVPVGQDVTASAGDHATLTGPVYWLVEGEVMRDPVTVSLLLRNRGAFDFEPQVLLEGVGRVACAEAADLDGDGDLDIAVCVFGDVTGKVLWLEQKDGFTFEEHVLDPRPGSIHAFPFDADGDGDLDLAVALSQDSEQVLLFRNGGRGDFASEVLFDAGVPYYGTSGIELSDLDQDGDTDILYTNGDEGDGPLPDGLDPYEVHGLAWFENDGSGHFAVHDILRHWGAYSVRGFDIDGDLDTDLVLSAVQVPGRYTDVVIRELVWLENDGQQGFTARYVAGAPPRLITIEAADLDGDGKAEVLGGSFNECGIVASEEELGTSCPTVGHRLATFSISADAPAKLELPASGDASVRLLLGALFAAGAGLAFGGLALIRRSDRSGGKRRRLPRHV